MFYLIKLCVSYLEELSGVLISVSDSDCFAINADIKTNSEVKWLVWTLVRFKNHLSFQEDTLRSSTVHFLGLVD